MVKSPKSGRELDSTTARKGPKFYHRLLEYVFDGRGGDSGGGRRD